MTFHTVKYEIRLSDGDHDNESKTFDGDDSETRARAFADNEWVISPRVFKSDEWGNEIPMAGYTFRNGRLV